jgi:type 1 glutamine amidotransferase
MRCVVLCLLVVAAGCSSSDTPSSPGTATGPPVRVLMLTATAGFRHDSIPVARQVMASLSTTTRELDLKATEDLSELSASNLASYDVLFFALTSGELPVTADQRSAILGFVSGGHGFVGVHSASDTLHGWPEYGELVGAFFKEHPWTQPGTVIVEDPSHPATAGLGDRLTLTEEFYTFVENPRPRVHVLLRLDAASVGASGDFPLAWWHSYGSGRAYYNALGHFSETWNDPRFQRQIVGAIRWAAGR